MKKTEEQLIRVVNEVFLVSALRKHEVDSGEEKHLKGTDVLTLKA